MMSNPKPGQRCRLHYATKRRGPLHGKAGTVEIASKGRPRNHLVQLDDGTRVVVPCGNLQRETK